MKPLDFPNNIGIQTTTLCNSRCTFCTNKDMPKKVMSWDDCRSIIDQCIGKKVGGIIPAINNEPLLTPYILEFCEYTKRTIPETDVYFYTNGINLDEETTSKLRIDKIFFSLGGYDKESYLRVNQVDKYDLVVENITRFIRIRKIPTYIILNLTIDNFDNNKKFIDFWKPKGIEVFCVPVARRYNDDKCLIPRNNLKLPCKKIFDNLYIDTDCNAVLCCEDWKSECILGNVTEGIEKIWMNSKYTEYRQLHLDGRKSEIPLCKNCGSPYSD